MCFFLFNVAQEGDSTPFTAFSEVKLVDYLRHVYKCKNVKPVPKNYYSLKSIQITEIIFGSITLLKQKMIVEFPQSSTCSTVNPSVP